MQVALSDAARHHGAHVVLDRVSLTLVRGSRVGVVGPNGSGKSTLLRLLAGIEQPDAGHLTIVGSVGYLPQEPDVVAGETLLQTLRRRTGVARAEMAVVEATDPFDPVQYAEALELLLALGGGDLEARARVVCSELRLPVPLHQDTSILSGGETARAMLASVLLSRFDVALLDEPTNDLDLDGIERLERFVLSHGGAVAVVSHDRRFLDAVVTRIVEVDPWTKGIHELAGGWSAYHAARARARDLQYKRYAEMRTRERAAAELLSTRGTEARAGGKMANRRGTHALRSKVRQAQRRLERIERVDKPYEPWELRLRLEPLAVSGRQMLASLDEAVGELGSFRLGPVSFAVAPGDRVAVTGRNGSGKTTLLRMLVGEVELAAGKRTIGPATRIGWLEQDRLVYGDDQPLLDAFACRTSHDEQDARTLLAKFGLGADTVARPGRMLSPGERTRAELAELQARRVNLLVLDEPTNHLDLEAVEQLEAALRSFTGGLVLVTHDRHFFEAVGATLVVPL